MAHKIYADYNATTPLCPGAKDKILESFEIWGNPSSTHGIGREANEFLESCRARVAEAAGAKPEELVFTSGGAESNTMAILGSRFLAPEFRLITSGIEHSSVKGAAAFVEQLGGQVRRVPTLNEGTIDLDALDRLLTEFKPHLVSIMAANNETGVILPVDEISELCRRHKVPFHTDAVQAFGKSPSALWEGADLVSVSAHKIGGPKGVGALVVRGGRQLVCTHFGGSQERKRRGGTQNMVGIAGFAGACGDLPDADALAALEKRRNRFEKRLQETLEGVSVQGQTLPRVPTTSNVRFAGIRGEVLLGALDLDGICVSAGSACASGSLIPSHVLTAMGLTEDEAKECLRFSFSWLAPAEDVDTVTDTVIAHVQRIRERRKP